MFDRTRQDYTKYFGILLVQHIRNMTAAMDIQHIRLSSVNDKKEFYESQGFQYEGTHLNSQQPQNFSLLGKSPNEKKAILKRYCQNKVPDGESSLYCMTRSVPTPKQSPLYMTPNQSPEFRTPLSSPMRSKSKSKSASRKRSRSVKPAHLPSVGQIFRKTRSHTRKKTGMGLL